ncbi:MULTISPECIES: hypothetical protein [Vibrio]|uniref:Copper-binding protein n=1 Tax=Vibrio coralliirubri TaxID=1516159 RepID=A0AA86X3A2_9VIBR|nr:hypothetical protein [Vibrio coralliirubri]CDT87793.1 hypothetical protein VCR31J2_1380114 [Vibrio coralliirubri]
MTNTFRKTWIIVFSIIAMLMSSYASSSSAMMANIMATQMMSNKSICQHNDSPSDPDAANQFAAGCHVTVSDPDMSDHVHASTPNGDQSVHGAHSAHDDHAIYVELSADDKMASHQESMDAHGEHVMGNNCCGGSDSAHICCYSVCSTASHTIQALQANYQISSSFALHHSVTIGQKVTRAQSLLRPPSA